MKCPKCKDSTEVLETRTIASGIRRRRRCINPHCEHRFTTTEAARHPSAEGADDAAIRARALAKEFSSRVVDREALEAALATDMRRAAIKRAARARRRADSAIWLDDDNGFDPAPVRLDREGLKREMGEY